MGSRVMDKANQEQNQNQNQNHQQAVLKCPRCDSSNTKFCYYNNYSLSQPRHFCKACKRYWTRGGTLRNVPVGGGCRKNKRVIKRSSSSALDSNAPTISSSSSPTPTPTSNPNHNHHQILQNHINLSSNPLFYGLATNPSDLVTHPYPSNFTSRVSNVSHGFDLQSQLNGLGLGFEPLNKPMQGVNTSNGSGTCLSNPLLSSSYSLFGSSNYPTMASFLASSLPRQQKFKQEGTPAATNFQGSVPYEDHLQQIMSRNNGEVKMEQASQKRLDWNIMNVPNFQNEIEAQVISSQTDPSLYWNHPTSFGGGTNWLDPPLNGSPAPSLI